MNMTISCLPVTIGLVCYYDSWTVEIKVLIEKPRHAQLETNSQIHSPAWIMSFAHSLQGKSATYIVQPLTSAEFLFMMAFSSAWHTATRHERPVKNVHGSQKRIHGAQNDASWLWLTILLHNKHGLSFLCLSTLYHSTSKKAPVTSSLI